MKASGAKATTRRGVKGKKPKYLYFEPNSIKHVTEQAEKSDVSESRYVEHLIKKDMRQKKC